MSEDKTINQHTHQHNHKGHDHSGHHDHQGHDHSGHHDHQGHGHHHHDQHGSHTDVNKHHFNEFASKYDDAPGTKERTQFCYSALLSVKEAHWDPSKTRALDFACGTGLISQKLVEHVHSIDGFDISDKSIEIFNSKFKDNSNVKGYCLDITQAKNNEGKLYDVIYVVNALHHVDDPKKIVKALGEWLDSSGVLIILDFFECEETRSAFQKTRNNSHRHTCSHHGFTEDHIKEIFGHSGLETVHVDTRSLEQKIPDGEEMVSFKYIVAAAKKQKI